MGSGIVGITTGYGVDGLGFESRPEQEIFSSARPSGPALGPTRPPVKNPLEFVSGEKAAEA